MRGLLLVLLVALAVVPTAGAWTWPADGPVLQPFAFDPARIRTPRGSTAASTSAAMQVPSCVRPPRAPVSFAGTVPGSGKSVTIETADGWSVTLTHLGSITAKKGATVAEGDGVGTIGPSGEPEVSVPYVHLGVRLSEDPAGYVDPLGLLPEWAPAPGVAVATVVGDAAPPAAGAPGVTPEPVPVAPVDPPVAGPVPAVPETVAPADAGGGAVPASVPRHAPPTREHAEGLPSAGTPLAAPRSGSASVRRRSGRTGRSVRLGAWKPLAERPALTTPAGPARGRSSAAPVRPRRRRPRCSARPRRHRTVSARSHQRPPPAGRSLASRRVQSLGLEQLPLDRGRRAAKGNDDRRPKRRRADRPRPGVCPGGALRAAWRPAGPTDTRSYHGLRCRPTT